MLIMTSTGTATDIPRIATARSQILRASHIFSVAVVKLDGEEKERAILTGKVMGVMKGEIVEKMGQIFQTEISLYHGVVRDLPAEATGVWSVRHPKIGEQWTIFCGVKGTTRPHLRDLLRGLTPECTTAFLADEVASDLALAAELESQGMPFMEKMRLANEHAAGLGLLFPPYFWERHEAQAQSDFTVFEAFLAWMESPALAIRARGELFRAISHTLTQSHGLPTANNRAENRFIVSAFRLLEVPAEVGIFEVYLPNWLGIDSGMRRRKPKEVFKDYPQDRKRARRNLEKRSSQEWAKPLRTWIR